MKASSRPPLGPSALAFDSAAFRLAFVLGAGAAGVTLGTGSSDFFASASADIHEAAHVNIQLVVQTLPRNSTQQFETSVLAIACTFTWSLHICHCLFLLCDSACSCLKSCALLQPRVVCCVTIVDGQRWDTICWHLRLLPADSLCNTSACKINPVSGSL